MLFNSYIFVLLFLPMCISGYFLLHYLNYPKVAQLFLLGMSLWFYGYFNIKYLPIILTSILLNYMFFELLKKDFSRTIRLSALIVAIVFNLGILFYFKYYGFFIENINAVFHTGFITESLVLPLGISFFSFQQLSFVIDSYRRQVPDYGLLEYALFVTYFPQLIAGPIVTHDELVPQFNDKTKWKINWDNFACGIYIFALGMAKKALLADTLGNVANWGWNNIDSLDSLTALVIMLSYTFQIYFDFSGYCDMAIGIGKMMNIELPLNFNSPYKALTITEFWERWHITLTRFFTKYIYIPLGGNRKGKIRTYFNIMVVFLLSGLWHGANWTFILWGGMHGIYSVITRHFDNFFKRLHPVVNWILTFSFVNFAWLFFRSETIEDALRIGHCVFEMRFDGLNKGIISVFDTLEMRIINGIVRLFTRCDLSLLCPGLYLLVCLGVILIFILRMRNSYERMKSFSPTIEKSVVTAILMVWSICSFAGISTFLYFNF